MENFTNIVKKAEFNENPKRQKIIIKKAKMSAVRVKNFFGPIHICPFQIFGQTLYSAFYS